MAIGHQRRERKEHMRQADIWLSTDEESYTRTVKRIEQVMAVARELAGRQGSGPGSNMRRMTITCKERRQVEHDAAARMSICTWRRKAT